MSVINIRDLTFSYDGGYNTVFDGVSFVLDTDWRLALVGRNGRGKTTLCKLLLGKYEYGGSITGNAEFGYFPLDVKREDALAVDAVTEACPGAEEWELVRELNVMNADAGILYRAFSTLSSGEKTKVMLAALFCRDGCFLLIDEPTNHLDAAGRKAVSGYLARKKGFIVISHDRDFLDGCVDHVLAITRSGVEVRQGSYSAWLNDFEARQASEAASNARLQREISRLGEAARRNSVWADRTEKTKHGGKNSAGLHPDRGAIGHKAAKLMKRAKAAEDRIENAIAQKSKLLRDVEIAAELRLNPLEYRAERLLRVRGVAAVYDGKPVGSPADFELLRGDRLSLEGDNGSGKSSLLRVLAGGAAGDVPRYTGEAELGSGLALSYVPQNFDGGGESLSDYARRGGVDETLMRAVLNKMGLEGDTDGDISGFSDGQKKKLMLARSLCQSAHLYIWDEPLNYLDTSARLQLEKLILQNRPTMIFVEHDDAFRAAVATRSVRL